jgi:hypothetical protein
MIRMAYWGISRQFGKVITPVKVVIARIPGALKLTNDIVKFETKGIKLDPELHFMIGVLASQINGCDFCMDPSDVQWLSESASGWRNLTLLRSTKRVHCFPIESVPLWPSLKKRRETRKCPIQLSAN